MGVFAAARFRQWCITLLLLSLIIGQMLILFKCGVKPVLLAFVLPLCATSLLFGLTVWLLRPTPQPALVASTPLPPADVVVRCGKTENSQALKELLRESKGARELLASLDERITALSGDVKAERTLLLRRLRKLRARQRKILHHLQPEETPELDNGQSLDLTRLFDDDQYTLRYDQIRQHLTQVSKDDLNQLLEVVIELLERQTQQAVIAANPTKN